MEDLFLLPHISPARASPCLVPKLMTCVDYVKYLPCPLLLIGFKQLRKMAGDWKKEKEHGRHIGPNKSLVVEHFHQSNDKSFSEKCSTDPHTTIFYKLSRSSDNTVIASLL